MDGQSKNEEIISLLQSKNRCLERLMESTRVFLKAPLETLIQADAESPTTLMIYENERGAVIRTLEMHDRKINDLISALSSSDKTEAFMESVKRELTNNERLILAVFNADDIVFRKIRDAQNQLTKLMAETRKSRDILSKFKSGTNVGTGEEMDRTL